MSHLSIALQRHCERRRFTQNDFARQSGLLPSTISRYFSQAPGDISNDNFLSFLKAFSNDSQVQAELVAARCLDVRIGPGSDQVEISLKKTGAAPIPAATVELTQETERAIAWLRSQCPLNPDLEKHLIGYAKLLGMK